MSVGSLLKLLIVFVTGFNLGLVAHKRFFCPKPFAVINKSSCKKFNIMNCVCPKQSAVQNSTRQETPLHKYSSKSNSKSKLIEKKYDNNNIINTEISIPKRPNKNISLEEKLLKERNNPRLNVLSLPIDITVCPEKRIQIKKHEMPWNVLVVDPNCANGYRRDIARITTVLINLYTPPVSLERDIVPSIKNLIKAYPFIRIKIGIPQNKKFYIKTSKMEVVRLPEEYTPGQVWNELVEKSNTRFVLVAHNVAHIDTDINLERLIREMYSLDTPVIGGSVKDITTGNWLPGCRQMAYRNYIVTYRSGYKKSVHDCLICDSISGPFLAEVDYMKANPLDETFSERIMFENFFFQLFLSKQKIALCADSMFNVDNELFKELSREDWLPFAKQRKINRLVIQSHIFEVAHEYSCSEIGLRTGQKLSRGKGRAIAPCDVNKLANHVKFVMKLCQDHNLICELVDGTLLGVVKFSGILPYEVDAEIQLASENFTALGQLEPEFQKAGYSLSTVINPESKQDPWGAYNSFGSGWKLKIYGKPWLHSKEMLKQGKRPTKAYFHGDWLNVEKQNAALQVRGKYGPEVFKHKEHVSVVPDEKESGSYSPCPELGAHFCLDKFPVDGNLNFGDPIP